MFPPGYGSILGLAPSNERGGNIPSSRWAERRGVRQGAGRGAALAIDEALSYARRGRGQRKWPSTGWASLTPAELDVEARGETLDQSSNRRAAVRVAGTVKTHLEHIYSKLDVSSRAELADEVVQHSA
jgi:hypothetical protein